MAHGFGNVSRFIAVERARFAFTDCAKAAVARADVAAQHEGRRTVGPALENIGATRFLTYRVQIQALDQLEHVSLVHRIAQPDLEPRRFGLARLLEIADYA